jgi:hypothetical protein
MGWDVIVLQTAPVVSTVSQLGDQSIKPLGSRDSVLNIIETVFPDTDVSDPGWIVIATDSYSIEISLIEAVQVESLMLHIHGSSAAIDAIARLCKVSGWQAFDTAAGEFLDFDSRDRDAGLRLSRQYRDQAAGEYGDRSIH